MIIWSLFLAGVLTGVVTTAAYRLASSLWRNRAGRLLLRLEACERKVAEMGDTVDAVTLRAGFKFGGDDDA